MRWLPSIVLAWVCAPTACLAYPIFGSESTDIRRLEYARLAEAGSVGGRQLLPGQQLTMADVDLRLLRHRDMELPPASAELSAQVKQLLGEDADRYAIAVLDLSDIDQPRYAEHNASVSQNPGSVGKIAVATAVFQALADAYPEDLESRRRVLRETMVAADDFILTDGHKVSLWDAPSRQLSRRPIEIGDRGSLWEYLDWMLSASSNAAAAMTIKQAMLLVQFGLQYPVDSEVEQRFFSQTPKAELNTLLAKTLHAPLERSGLDVTRFRQGSFFTANGKRKVPGTNSYATPRELMLYLLRLEQGRIVDEFSSREIKRLLYMTERRIRYASSPALQDAAVYFKSGSLYKCQPEPGFVCKKYHGNKLNLMNSVAIIESPANERRLHYLVTLISDVLRKNSAVEHQTLATRIHRLMEALHKQ